MPRAFVLLGRSGVPVIKNHIFQTVLVRSGPVHNPHAHGYSTGGSSSGSGRLLASNTVDLAIGADQGGSIRLPSANCGVVGLKPTWGLVPYTGCISLQATIDRVGPMAKNPAQIITIGVLQEGFSDPLTDPNVVTASHAAIPNLSSLDAEIKNISIPLHKESDMIWMVALPMSGTTQGLLSSPSGRKQLLFPERSEATGSKLSQAAFDSMGPGRQNIYLRALFLQENFGSGLHARCTNLLRKLNDEYDRAFKDVDVLVMPTIIYPPPKIEGRGGKVLGPLKMLSRTIGATYNTATFNSTGHPALSLPVGFVSSKEGDVWLPTGLQIVGRKFEDSLVLRIAASLEGMLGWKERKFGDEECVVMLCLLEAVRYIKLIERMVSRNQNSIASTSSSASIDSETAILTSSPFNAITRSLLPGI
ncbi:amidase signature domain-containing protein [Leptodontidium sp. 2 PMI_412]|nr:amidase signature domain-containing protein [Leptodontidium sp. 2 PMI_412]